VDLGFPLLNNANEFAKDYPKEAGSSKRHFDRPVGKEADMGSQRRWLLFWLWMFTSFCVLGSLVGCNGTERTIAQKPLAPVKTGPEVIDQSRVVSTLQRKLRERDHQLSVLRAQLEALKAIDEDQPHRVKVPASLLPVENYGGR
jgi:hypothetical protein